MECNQAGRVLLSAKLRSKLSLPETFPKFSKLPKELRLMIWREFRNTDDENYGGRIVTLCYNPKIGFYSKTSLPSAFFINREFYKEALRSLIPAFTSHLLTDGNLAKCAPPNSRPIYVNFTKDIIFLQEAEGNSIRPMIQAMSKDNLERIHHLAFNDPTLLRDFRSVDLTNLRRSIATMSGLQQLFTIRINAWLTWDRLAVAEAHHVLFQGRGVRGGVWQNVFMRQQMAEEIEILKRSYVGKAPAVFFICSYELLALPIGLQRCIGTLAAPKGRWSIGNPKAKG